MSQVNVPRKIIVHHTADESSGPQLEKVDAYHKGRFNFPARTGSYIGYHFFIERDGTTYQTRLNDEEGAHTKGQNLQSLGIALAGDFDVSLPSASQRLSLCKVIDKAVKVHQIPLSEIYPHRKFTPTSCYGLRLTDGWAREEYRSYLIANLHHLLIILKSLLEQLIYNVKSQIQPPSAF